MQQDGIQRAIETKQQQLKPLEAEVRGRSRQATKDSCTAIPASGVRSDGARVYRVQMRGRERCGCSHVDTVPKYDHKPYKCR